MGALGNQWNEYHGIAISLIKSFGTYMFIKHLLCASCGLSHGYVVKYKRQPCPHGAPGLVDSTWLGCGPGLGSVWIGGLTQQSQGIFCVQNQGACVLGVKGLEIS